MLTIHCNRQLVGKAMNKISNYVIHCLSYWHLIVMIIFVTINILFCKFDFATTVFKWELCTLPSELLSLIRHVYICNFLYVGLGDHDL